MSIITITLHCSKREYSVTGKVSFIIEKVGRNLGFYTTKVVNCNAKSIHFWNGTFRMFGMNLTLIVSRKGIFDKCDFGLFLLSEPNDDVPLSFDPSDSEIKSIHKHTK